MDECHLMAGDLEGYVWGTRGVRVEVPIVNERERQTYYGALDLLSKRVFIEAHTAGNTANTLTYLKFLQRQFEGQRLLLLWDGAITGRTKFASFWRWRTQACRKRSGRFTAFSSRRMTRARTRLKMFSCKRRTGCAGWRA